MVVLCDSSVWIDALNGRSTLKTAAFRKADERDRLVVGDLVAVEVLQGIRDDLRHDRIRSLFDRYEFVSLCNRDIALKAAANYRALRQRGITVRGTIDVIVATWCIENDVPIIHNDRDMAVMERELGLRAYA